MVDGNASTLFAVVGGISVVFATRSYLERGYVAAARWAMAARGLLVILIGSPGFGAPLYPEWWALALLTPHTGTTLDILRGVGIALFTIASMLFLARVLPPATLRVLGPIRAAGAAPLTVYTAHVLAEAAATFLLASSGPLEPPEEIPWWFLGPVILGIHILGAVVIGAILAALKRRGPLEAFVSSTSGAVARRLGDSTTDGRRRHA